MDLTSGSKVFDKFEVIDQIGAGGMGAIYKANHVLLNRVVVLKVLSISTTVKKSLLRFQNEAKTLSKLNHPGIAKVYDFGLSDNVPYIALEFIEGKTLMEVLNEKGSLAADEALPLILQLCDALSHAHACEIVHRDLKPSNIVLRQSGEETQVVLLDFGIAKLLADSDSSLTHAGDIIGSPPYMSPEQCTGKPTSYGTDQYSLGCVIFEMLTGEPPFVGETALHTMLLHQQEQPPLLSSRCPSPVPQQLEELVAKLLAKNEGDRFESIKGVASAIMVLIPTLSRTPEGEYSRADRSAVSGLARIRSVRSRNFVYAALLVCSLGALVFFVLLNRGSKPMDGSAKADSGNEQYLMKLARVGEKAKVVNDPEYQIAFVDHRYLYAEEEETDLSNWNHLQRVDLSDSAVTDKDLSVLRGKKIINLTLKGCEIHSVENILQLPYLTYLDLGKTPIGDKELKQLASLKMLQTLLIQKTNVTPEGLQALKRFALLHTVFLSGPGKTIDELRKAMPGCKFRPYYEQSITDEMVTTEVLPQARQQCRNCIKVIEKAQGKNAPRAIAYLSSLVVRSLQMSKFKEAMRENDEALTVSQTMNNTVLLQQALGNKASIFYFMHLKETKPKKSMAYMKQAARFARESLSLKKDLIFKDDPALVKDYDDAVCWAQEVHELPEAVELSKEGLEICDHYQKENPSACRFREIVGWDFFSKHEREKSAPFFLANVNYYRSKQMLDHPNYIRALMILGHCLKNPSERKELYGEALYYYSRNPAKVNFVDRYHICDSYAQLAEIYRVEGKRRQVINCWLKAFEVAQTIKPRPVDRRIETYGETLIPLLRNAGRESEIEHVKQQMAKYGYSAD